MPTATLEAIERKLARGLARAVADFAMIEDGDRILVAVSGGKDSYTLLHLLRGLQAPGPVAFRDRGRERRPGPPRVPGAPPPRLHGARGLRFTLIEEDTYSIVTDKIPAGKTYCSLCSRLRRGILYRVATELGCKKIALGHHRDDVLQTLLLNLLFSGQARVDAPEAPRRRRRARGHAATRLLRRGGHPRLRGARSVPDPPVRPLRLAGAACSEKSSRGCSTASSAIVRGRRPS